MKKLILLTGAIVFIGNITGQRISENLIPASFDPTPGPGYTINTFTTVQCCMCYNQYTRIESDEKMKKMMDEMFMTRIENINVIVGGLPDDIVRINDEPFTNPVNEDKKPVVVAETLPVFTLSTTKCFQGFYTKDLDGPIAVNPLPMVDMTQLTFQPINTQPNVKSIIDGCPLGLKKQPEFPGYIGSYGAKEEVKKTSTAISVITITPADIKRIPNVTAEVDVASIITRIGCPTSSVIIDDTPVVAEEAADAKASQGPFTGLEGHNFLEDPAIIYPNPVKDVLNVKSTDPITVIEILGVHGQIETTLDPRSTMDVSTLAAGTYYARIYFENIKEVQVEKILVVK